MRQRRHALSGALYDVQDDGNVHVTARDGISGVFTPDGVWLSGELRSCDAHLAGWLAGPQVPSGRLPRFLDTSSASTQKVNA